MCKDQHVITNKSTLSGAKGISLLNIWKRELSIPNAFSTVIQIIFIK